VAFRLRSGSPLCAFDEELRIVAWNEAAECLTGIPAREALSRPCWSVLGGTADDGSLVCHRGCSGARLARDGWPLRPQTLTVKTAAGRRRMAVDTVTAGDVFVHLMRPAPRPDPPQRVPSVRLTPRRLQALGLLADGLSVRRIASCMGVRESTARNHVHGLLLDLDAHSQLEAVSRGRAEGLI
jgi:DNA-binding CsgD family transcriptional regulator